jgi:hypothetical protein
MCAVRYTNQTTSSSEFGFISSEAPIMLKKLFCSLIFLLGAGLLLAQTGPSSNTPPSQNRPMRGGGQGACMQQAGIDKSAMEQIHSIVREAHSQVESVCSNSSLTPQQKQQQVREIRERAMQQRDGLMTADQQKALMACQQARNGNHAGAARPHEGGLHGGMGGGCGEMQHNGSRPGGSANRAPGSGTSNPSTQN